MVNARVCMLQLNEAEHMSCIQNAPPRTAPAGRSRAGPAAASPPEQAPTRAPAPAAPPPPAAPTRRRRDRRPRRCRSRRCRCRRARTPPRRCRRAPARRRRRSGTRAAAPGMHKVIKKTLTLSEFISGVVCLDIPFPRYCSHGCTCTLPLHGLPEMHKLLLDSSPNAATLMLLEVMAAPCAAPLPDD